jgi:hypothetical protein
LCKQTLEVVTINQGCFTIGLRQNTSEHSVIIMIMALRPVLVLVLLWTLKLEALTIARVLGMAICFLGVAPLETESGYSKHSPLLVGDQPDHAFEYHRLRHLHRSGEKSRARIRCGLDEHFSSGRLRRARVGWAGRTGMFYMLG